MWSVSDHVAPFVCMAAIIIGSQAVRQHLQNARARGEAGRLRGALAISLQALRKLYQDNLVVLAGGKPPLISGRNQIALMRQQLGQRLVSLGENEIAAVLFANIAAEGAETAMAVSGTPLRGVAYTVPEGNFARGKLESTLMEACSKIEAAEHLLTPSPAGRDAEPSADATVIEFASHALRKKRRLLGTRPEHASTSAP